MAIKFVKVRRVDDHSVTAELAEESLPVWEGFWERIPDDELAASDEPVPSADSPAAPGAAEDTSSKQTRKSRSSAANDAKE